MCSAKMSWGTLTLVQPEPSPTVSYLRTPLEAKGSAVILTLSKNVLLSMESLKLKSSELMMYSISSVPLTLASVADGPSF